ncbi:MAG: hypothetical protein QM765_36315 [Myxococcales bacterium]
MPGLLALQCSMDASSGAPAQARPLCERALREYDERVQAHDLLGLLDRSAEHLRRTLALDPGTRSAYVQLDRVLESSPGSAGERAELSKKYQARFGQALPR